SSVAPLCGIQPLHKHCPGAAPKEWDFPRATVSPISTAPSRAQRFFTVILREGIRAKVLRAWEIFELEIEQHNSDRQTAPNGFWLCALRTVGCRFAMDRLPAIPARTTISPWVATDI